MLVLDWYEIRPLHTTTDEDPRYRGTIRVEGTFLLVPTPEFGHYVRGTVDGQRTVVDAEGSTFDEVRQRIDWILDHLEPANFSGLVS